MGSPAPHGRPIHQSEIIAEINAKEQTDVLKELIRQDRIRKNWSEPRENGP